MYGREHGVRMGIGGVTTSEMRQRQRQAHVNKVISDVFEFDKDPYMTTTDMGIIECQLCTTGHRTKQSYILHTEGKKHKENLAVRQYHINKAKNRNQNYLTMPAQNMSLNNGLGPTLRKSPINKPRIGKPSYSLIKQYHPTEGFHALAFKIEYPLIEKGLKPRYRIINTYAQNVEAPHEGYQYLVVAAEPYENIAFKIPNRPIDLTKLLRDWDTTTFTFLLQIKFRDDFNSKFRNQQQQQQQQQQDVVPPLQPTVPSQTTTE